MARISTAVAAAGSSASTTGHARCEGGGEDFRAAEISQQGLNAGVPEETVYCGLETNIVRYYEAIEALL